MCSDCPRASDILVFSEVVWRSPAGVAAANGGCMETTVVRTAAWVVALVIGSALVHIGVGFLTNQMVEQRMKQYEQRWKEEDARIHKLESEIQRLEKQRDALQAAARDEVNQAAAISAQGAQREEELRKTPLTPEETARNNGTRPVRTTPIVTGATKGQLHWGPKPNPAQVVDSKNSVGGAGPAGALP